ncbi:MAG: hypothetical protein ABF242_04770 [Flavobacteriales bacterium]
MIYSIDKIKETYYNFADALINNFTYDSSSSKAGVKGKITIIINCMSEENNGEFETLKLIFEDVIEFRFVDHYNTCSTVIDEVYIDKNNKGFLIDFFPTDTGDKIITSANSDLSITFKKLTIFKKE